MERKYQLTDGTFVDFETYMVHTMGNTVQKVNGLYAVLDVAPENLIMKVKNKNFWNGWDFKSLLQIVTPIIMIIFYSGSVTEGIKQNTKEIKDNKQDIINLKKDNTDVKSDINILTYKTDALKQELNNHILGTINIDNYGKHTTN